MRKLFTRNTLLFSIAFLIALTASISAFYFYGKYKKTLSTINNPSEIARLDSKKLIAQVGSLIELPGDETPTIATISDLEKLADQPFYAKAKIGDKVLIYTKNKKAFLYDPIANKIINVAPIIMGSASADLKEAEISPAPVSLLLYNGTTTAGLTRQYETELKKLFPNAQVLDRQNAQKSDYQKSILVDINENNPSQAQDLAQKLNLSLESLPNGETASTAAEYLIILGSDKSI